MKKELARKLQLSKETLVNLTAGELAKAVGGTEGSTNNNSPSVAFTECYTACSCLNGQ